MQQKAPPPPPRQFLHTFSDGSVLRKMAARDFVSIEVWDGNRNLNLEHKKKIQESLRNGIRSLDLKPFHIVRYPVEDEREGGQSFKTYIIDGQHRTSILKDAFQQNPETLNFDVLVVDYSCSSEEEAVAYFKILNNTCAIQWKEDPKLLTHSFIVAMEKEFNNGKLKLIRQTTHRPYLSTEKLREAMLKHKVCEKGKKPAEFVEFCKAKNKENLEFYKAMKEKDKATERFIELGFCLAHDEKFKWMEDF
jgi:hypothetical protein